MNVKEPIKIVLFSLISTMIFNIVFNGISQNVNFFSIKYNQIIKLAVDLNVIKFILVLLVFIVFYGCLLHRMRKVEEFLFKYRIILYLLLFIIAVVLELHGSSIGMWETFIYGTSHHSLLGISRLIRSDEWAVFTPMTFSQYFDSFSYFSNIIRGTTTDVFIIYGLPVKDIAMIFRPFQLGYLFLSSGKGLAFFWAGRFIALFAVSFEFGLLISNRNKRLSLIYAILIVCAPIIQWWFSINGLVEMFISGQACILILHKYPSITKIQNKLFLIILLYIFIGCYALTLYPAWMIPLAYVFLLLAIWVIVKKWNQYKELHLFPDLLIFGVCFIPFFLIMLHIASNSLDTIHSVMATVYPGSRLENGGGGIEQLFYYPATIFFTIIEDGLKGNVCENAVFFDLFPIGIILSIYYLTKKGKDFLLISQLILLLYFILRCWLKWPTMLSRFSLLFVVQSNRMFVGIGFINIILLIRSLSLIKKVEINIPIKIGIIIGLSFIVLSLSYYYLPEYYHKSMIVVGGILLIALFSSILFYDKQCAKDFFLILTVFVAIVGGFAVNPVEIGVNYINEMPIMKEIKSEVQNDTKSIWINELPMPLSNLTIMCGASTINSTNTYPNLKMWELVDSKNKYQNIYNRYANIEVSLQNNKETEFKLLNPDKFLVELNINDLKTLNIKKICTNRSIEYLSNDNVTFEKQYDSDGYKIYNVEYLT